MDIEKSNLEETAFYNLQKNLDIQFVKTGEKDWFHSGYRLLDYWVTKEKVEEVYTYLENQVNLGNIKTINILDDIRKILGDFK